MAVVIGVIFQLYKEGLLEVEYDRVVGKNSYERLKQDGFIRKDRTIPELFARLKED